MAYTTATDSKPKSKISKKDEKEIVDLLNEYFEQALDDPAWVEARKEMVQCFDYKENRQWTKSELAELAERGQPPTINNQVKVTIDRIVGQFVQAKSKTVYKPRNQPFDINKANTMSDIYTYIRQRSGLEFEERDVVEDGATGGFGVFEVCINDDDPMDKEVLVKAEDCFNIFPDPKSRRYDWNDDARYICRGKWVDVAYAKELYPHKKREIGALMGAGQTQLANVDELRQERYVDYKRNRIRLVEVQYKKFVNATKYVFSDGKVFDEDEVEENDYLSKAEAAGVSWETKDERKEHICIGVFSENILFEHGVSKRQRFSFVPFFVNRKKSGAPYSMITTALPIQDAINKRESKALHLLTLNQTRAEKGAVDDKIDWTVQAAKPDGFLEVNEGFFDKVVLDKNLELAQSQHAMHLASKVDFRQVTGVNPDALGEKSEVRSGIGIQRKVAQTGLIVAPIFDNFRRTREVLAKTIHDAVTISYTPGKILTITDNPQASRSIALTDDEFEAIKTTNYDVIVSEQPDFDTVHEQQMEIISSSLPAILQFGPAWAEVLFEMSSIRDKDMIMQKVRKVAAENSPPNAPKLSVSAQMADLTLPEKIFYYQQMKAPPELIQALQQMNTPPAYMVAQQGQAANAQAQAQAKMQVDHHKAQMDMQGKQMEMAAKREETQMQMQSLEAKTQADIVGAQIDMQLGQLDLQKKQMEIAAAQVKASQPQGEDRD